MTVPKRFVNLHGHTCFSINDALGFPQEHIDAVIESGMNAWAMTDHGNMNGYPHAYLKAKDLKKDGHDFKFIPGAELYLTPDLEEWNKLRAEQADDKKNKSKREKNTGSAEDEESSKTNKRVNPLNRRHHLVILAKSSIGLKNLFTLVSRGSSEGFYRYPRIDYRMLKEHCEDLIISTACLAGPISYDILRSFDDVAWDDLGSIDINKCDVDGVIAKATTTLDRLVDAIGLQNVFLEMQFNAIPAQHLVNYFIQKLSQVHGIPLIVTNDAHYPKRDHWQSREIYKKLAWMNYEDYDTALLPKTIDDVGYELYPKNAEQVWSSYKKYCKDHSFYDDDIIRAAIERTYDIANDMIGNTDPDTSIKLPSYVVDESGDEVKQLTIMCLKGLKDLGLHINDEYIARLKHELKLIADKNFVRYFLTMKAIIDVARKHMLVGSGRGSSCGSLVCYVLGITQVDPIKYGLLFSRFMNAHRNAYPDIDTDIADRDLLIDLLKKEFGDHNVIPISNFNTLKLNSLIRDLSRFYGIEFGEVNRIMKQAEAEVKRAVLTRGVDKNTFEMTFDLALEHSKSFKEFMDDNPEIAKHVPVLIKQNKTIGKHAGGVIIAENILENMPVIRVRGELQTPWTEGLHRKDLPAFGWVKFDLLGLETLRIVEQSIKNILSNRAKEYGLFEIETIDGKIKRYYGDELIETENGLVKVSELVNETTT